MRKSARSRQLTAERWERRQAEATTPRARAMVLMEMARAFAADDDPLWEELVGLLAGRLSRLSL
ncbi:hypothetical protein ACFV5N_11825 [Streptomyces sp. NPDC059853]|uniref:hypothetical protein n=1 Tax=Streptomyces sp. NPDC059853 TaxID=3346973 RepID=UPI0036557EE8